MSFGLERLPRGRTRRAVKRILIFIICLLFLVEIGVALFLIHKNSTNQSQFSDLETVRIESQQIPLSAGAFKENGIIKPTTDSIVTDKDISLDLSNLDRGYILIRYDGPRSQLVLDVTSIDHNGNVHNNNMNSKEPLHPYYVYPVGTGWQGYALPYGSGTYRIKCLPYEKENLKSLKTETPGFEFVANFDEVSPYRYSNVYSSYDKNSTAVSVGRYLISQEEKAQGCLLTDKKKTELISGYIRRNIREDAELLKQSSVGKDSSSTYRFPDIEAAMNTGIGNCNERSAITAIILKSQNIPVQIVHGYILRNEGVWKEPLKIYHAWLNVYIEGRWAMYDPTFSDTEITDPVKNGDCEYLLDTALIR